MTESTPLDGVARRSLRVLVVEDNDDAREMLETLLEVWGHAVSSAADGNSGVAKALDERPDIALVDIGLAGIDGYEVARRIRTAIPKPGIGLVAMTGYGQLEDRHRALAAGFDVHVVKPVHDTDLQRVLGMFAGGAERGPRPGG